MFTRGATFSSPHCGVAHVKTHDILNDDGTRHHPQTQNTLLQ